MTDNRTKQLLDVGFPIKEVGVLDQLFRPQLIADGVCGDDGAGRQRTLRDENLRALRFDNRCGLCLRSCCVGRR